MILRLYASYAPTRRGGGGRAGPAARRPPG
jgi:hypothetical protein